jgi:cytochrome o ubiquinol oxidase subunit III
MLAQIKQRGLILENKRRLSCLSLFWHFLDIIWIGVFTFVYLFGVIR